MLVNELVALLQLLLDGADVSALVVQGTWRSRDVPGGTLVEEADLVAVEHALLSLLALYFGILSHEFNRNHNDLIVDQGAEHQQEESKQLGPVELLDLGRELDDPDEQRPAGVNRGALSGRCVLRNGLAGGVEGRNRNDDAQAHQQQLVVLSQLLEGQG